MTRASIYMGSQYMGCYLINWTLSRTFMLLNVVQIYFWTHVGILAVILHQSGSLVVKTVCVLLLYVGLVCLLMFVGVFYLILIDTLFVFTVLWIWTELATTKISHKTYYTAR